MQGRDLPSSDVRCAHPYSIYGTRRNARFIDIGTDHDTGAVAVAPICGWWRAEGRKIYARAKQILITADSGGSNGYRQPPWKLELQKFADQTGLAVSVYRVPPGTSKWNEVERRLFSFISPNWREEPLRDYETIVHLTAKTTAAKRLKVTWQLDRRKYSTGGKVSVAQLERVKRQPNRFHDEWNNRIFLSHNA